jgi:hypothetical protein
MGTDEQPLGQLRPSTKLNTQRDFLQALHSLERPAAVGRRSGVDIEQVSLAPRAGRGPA